MNKVKIILFALSLQSFAFASDACYPFLYQAIQADKELQSLIRQKKAPIALEAQFIWGRNPFKVTSKKAASRGFLILTETAALFWPLFRSKKKYSRQDFILVINEVELPIQVKFRGYKKPTLYFSKPAKKPLTIQPSQLLTSSRDWTKQWPTIVKNFSTALNHPTSILKIEEWENEIIEGQKMFSKDFARTGEFFAREDKNIEEKLDEIKNSISAEKDKLSAITEPFGGFSDRWSEDQLSAYNNSSKSAFSVANSYLRSLIFKQAEYEANKRELEHKKSVAGHAFSSVKAGESFVTEFWENADELEKSDVFELNQKIGKWKWAQKMLTYEDELFAERPYIYPLFLQREAAFGKNNPKKANLPLALSIQLNEVLHFGGCKGSAQSAYDQALRHLGLRKKTGRSIASQKKP